MLLAPPGVAHCSCHDGGSHQSSGQEAHQVQPAQLLEGGDQEHGQGDCQGQASSHMEGAEAPQACRAANIMLLSKKAIPVGHVAGFETTQACWPAKAIMLRSWA